MTKEDYEKEGNEYNIKVSKMDTLTTDNYEENS